MAVAAPAPVTAIPEGAARCRETRIVSRALGDGRLQISGACRRRTSLAGEWMTDEYTGVTVELDVERRVHRVQSSDAAVEAIGLVGLTLGGGFRGFVAGAAGDPASPLSRVLLDQLPGASVVAGYNRLYEASIDPPPTRTNRPIVKADICAGWRSDGTMVRLIEKDGALPVPVGPVFDPGTVSDDGWSPAVSGLVAGDVRRELRYTVVPAESAGCSVEAWLRDSHQRPEGELAAVHEYTLLAHLDDHGVVRAAEAIPRVLPWTECPTAIDSVKRLIGMPASEIRTHVSAEWRGTATCTHLNDLARGLAEMPALAGELSGRFTEQ